MCEAFVPGGAFVDVFVAPDGLTAGCKLVARVIAVVGASLYLFGCAFFSILLLRGLIGRMIIGLTAFKFALVTFLLLYSLFWNCINVNTAYMANSLHI